MSSFFWRNHEKSTKILKHRFDNANKQKVQGWVSTYFFKKGIWCTSDCLSLSIFEEVKSRGNGESKLLKRIVFGKKRDIQKSNKIFQWKCYSHISSFVQRIPVFKLCSKCLLLLAQQTTSKTNETKRMLSFQYKVFFSFWIMFQVQIKMRKNPSEAHSEMKELWVNLGFFDMALMSIWSWFRRSEVFRGLNVD